MSSHIQSKQQYHSHGTGTSGAQHVWQSAYCTCITGTSGAAQLPQSHNEVLLGQNHSVWDSMILILAAREILYTGPLSLWHYGIFSLNFGLRSIKDIVIQLNIIQTSSRPNKGSKDYAPQSIMFSCSFQNASNLLSESGFIKTFIIKIHNVSICLNK